MPNPEILSMIAQAHESQRSAEFHPGTCPPEITAGLRMEISRIAMKKNLQNMMPPSGTIYDPADVPPEVKQAYQDIGGL